MSLCTFSSVLKGSYMKNLFITFSIFAFAIAQGNWTSGGKLKAEQAIMDIQHYTVALTIDPAKKRIDGYTIIDFNLTAKSKVLLFDLVDHYAVEKVEVNGKENKFSHEADLINIALDQELAAGAVSVKIEYGGVPNIAVRPPWQGGFQFETDSHGFPWVAVTCQLEGSKIIFPSKDHPSDEATHGAEMILTVPKGLTAVAAGVLKEVTHAEKTSTFHWETNYTINNYGLTFDVGNYELHERQFKTVEGNNVPMQAYLLKHNADKAESLLDIFEQSANVLEKYFGEYPWVKEKMAVVETPHLGMEHQTHNAYGNKFRYTKIGGKETDWLLHHELGHEWWGNKVTANDWADFWIQEGICSFGDAMLTRELAGEEAYIKVMKERAKNSKNKAPIVLGKDIDIDAAYNPDIYGKGAFFMHSLRYVVGDEVFFPTIKKLSTDKKYTYHNRVVSADVEKLFSEASGKDLKPLFNLYLNTTDKLELEMIKTDENSYTIKLKNLEGSWPIDVKTDQGIKRVNLIGNEAITIKSKTAPIIDPNTYYLSNIK